MNLRLVITTFLLSAGFAFAQTGTGSIKGTVTDKTSGEPLPFVKVIIYQGDQQKGFAATDVMGKFLIVRLRRDNMTLNCVLLVISLFVKPE